MELAEHITRNMISTTSTPIVILHKCSRSRLYISVGAGGVESIVIMAIFVLTVAYNVLHRASNNTHAEPHLGQASSPRDDFHVVSIIVIKSLQLMSFLAAGNFAELCLRDSFHEYIQASHDLLHALCVVEIPIRSLHHLLDFQ